MTVQRKMATVLAVVFFVLSTAEVMCPVWWGRALLSLPLGIMAAAGIGPVIDRALKDKRPPG